MAGTKAGGLKAKATNLARDPNFYARIGSIGGKNGTTGGFFSAVCDGCDWFDEPHKKAECAGAIGGRKSKRTKVA